MVTPQAGLALRFRVVGCPFSPLLNIPVNPDFSSRLGTSVCMRVQTVPGGNVSGSRNLRARTGRIANPPQDAILPHNRINNLDQGFWRVQTRHAEACATLPPSNSV